MIFLTTAIDKNKNRPAIRVIFFVFLSRQLSPSGYSRFIPW